MNKSWQDIVKERNKETNSISTKWQDIVHERGGVQNFSDYNNDSTEQGRLKALPKPTTKTVINNPKEKSFLNKVGDFLLGTPKPLQAAINADNKGASLVKGFTDSTTLGLTEDSISKKLAKDHSINYNAGKMLGYITPGGLISKGVEKVAAKTLGSAAKEIGTRVATSAVTGGGLTAAENAVAQTKRVINNEPLKPTKDIMKEIGVNTAAGGLLDLGLMGLGKVGSKIGKSAFKSTVVETPINSMKLKGDLGKLQSLKSRNANIKVNDYYNNIDAQDYINSSDPKYIEAENKLRTSKGLKPLTPEEIAGGKPQKELPIQNPTKKPMTFEEFKSKITDVGSEYDEPYYKVDGEKYFTGFAEGRVGTKEAAYDDYIDMFNRNNKKTIEPINKQLKLNVLENSSLKTTTNQLSNIIELPDTRSHIVSKTAKEPGNIKKTLNKGYIKTFDDLSRLNDFDKAIEKATNENLSTDKKSYVLGLNSRGKDMVSKQILTQNLVDSKGNVVGDSLKSITKQIPKGKEKDFEDYLILNHAITRMDRGENVYPKTMDMTSQKALQKINQYNTTDPEFKQLSQKIYDYNNKLGKAWLVDTGIISPQEWEGYLKANPSYVPMNRAFSELERPTFKNGKGGFSGQTSPVKSAPGSQRPIISPIESMIEHTGQYVKTAKQNEVMQTIIENLKKNPEELSGWAELVDAPKDSIVNTLHSEGPEGVLKQINDSFETATRKPDLTKGNIVSGLINGERVHVKVNDPELLNALTNLSPGAQNILIKGVGKVTKTMKLLTTGVNPVFSLTRNVFRDIPTAYINSKSTNNPITFAKDLVGSMISVVKNDELYKSYKAMGGGHSSSISSDRNALLEAKNEILKTGPSLKKGLQKGLSALEKLNDAVETAPRLGEYKRISKNGDYASKVKGIYEANDVTVNFNKRGQWAKEADAVIPYLNAAFQGLDKLARTFTGDKKQVATASAKAFTSVTIPTMVLYAINHDNPDYKKVSNYVKDSNFLIPKGDGTFIKIPKPREVGTVFGSLVERELRDWKDHDPEAFKDFITTLKNNFAPPTRTVLHPALVDLTANKNYADAPIIPQDMINDNRSPKYQYDSKTSEISKFIGDKLNTSPMKLDYLAKSYLGGVAELGLPLATKTGSVGQTLKQKVTVDPAYSNDIIRNFYNTKNKLETLKTDNKLNGVVNKREDLIKLKKFDKASDRMSDIRKEIKKIQNDNTLQKQEKLDKLRILQEKMNEIANTVNKSQK